MLFGLVSMADSRRCTDGDVQMTIQRPLLCVVVETVPELHSCAVGEVGVEGIEAERIEDKVVAFLGPELILRVNLFAVFENDRGSHVGRVANS